MSGHPQDLSLREQASAVAGGELDPAELLDATLTRIEERNGPLNAFIATSPDDSRAMLAAAPPGPLRGVPIAVKDIFTLPWWAPLEGTAEPNPAFPPGESGVYRRLRDAGAVVVGVTHCHLLGAGSTGHLAAYGPCGNPWNSEHCAGGSSGGSASSVGARMVAGAVGTDGGGSVRLPSSYCGVTGLKATFGSTPGDGYLHAFETLGVGGPICRDAADCRLLGGVLTGASLAGSDEPLRVGIPRRVYWEDLDSEVETACQAAVDALAGAGATVTEVDIEGAELARVATVMTLTLENMPQLSPVTAVEEVDDFVMRALTKYQLLQPARILLQAGRVRSQLRRSLKRLFAEVDVLAWPATPAPAPPLADPSVELPSGRHPADRANVRQSGIANLTGVPGVSVPVGLHSSGLPIGLQFLAAWGADVRALDAAEALERATGRAHVDAVATVAA